jgi:anti-sigma factor RsiW
MRIPALDDGELDAMTSAEMERHLVACPACSEERAALRALRERIRAEVPYHTAPSSLRERVRGMVSVAASPPRARRWQWLVSGVAMGCAATVLAWFAGTAVLQSRERDSLSRQVVANHVRATLTDRRVAVASTDQHTVKPWLSARLDFSPPVKDLAAIGYTLEGARVDALDGQAVAALVYRYRYHTIDVFVRPEAGNDDAPVMHTLRGFNVAHLRNAEMGLWAVSDLNAEALATFVTALARSE